MAGDRSTDHGHTAEYVVIPGDTEPEHVARGWLMMSVPSGNEVLGISSCEGNNPESHINQPSVSVRYVMVLNFDCGSSDTDALKLNGRATRETQPFPIDSQAMPVRGSK